MTQGARCIYWSSNNDKF